MAAIKLLGFGGMVPALDPRLLDTNVAALSRNTWLYSGALIGIAEERPLHTCSTASTAKTYRIPASYTNAAQYDGSLWLEFTNRDTDVVRSSVVEDAYDRYYWTSTSHAPKYTTRERLEFTANVRTATVTMAGATDIITWTTHGLSAGDPVAFTGGTPSSPLVSGTTYYITLGSVTTNGFKVSSSLSLALQGTAINLTTDSSGTVTGTTKPKAEFTLGVPQPAALTGSVSGGSGTTETRSYVCTWVTAFGEEGPASTPLLVTGFINGTWNLNLPSVDPLDIGTNRYLRKTRIYRTVTSGSGVATYYLVAEKEIWDTTHADTASDTTVAANSQLESTVWVGPPATLEGFITMPNGIIAAWDDNDLWFCEPYRPHAWPVEYALAVEYPIVGLGVINQTLVVCTSGFPVTAVGVHPSVMTMSRLAAFEPCTSRNSIISTPEGVYYSSFNGIIKIVPGRAENITKDLLQKDDWQNTFEVTTIVGAQLGSALYYFGTATVGVFNVAFDTGAFVQEDLTSAFIGVLFDPTNPRVAFNKLTSEDVTVSVFNDQWTNNVFIIRDNVVYWIDPADPTPDITPYTWKSKVFQFDRPTNLRAMKVFFETVSTTPDLNPVPNTALDQDLAADQYGLIRIYADGTHIYTRELRTSGELWSLPSGFKANYYQFEIEARVRVMSLQAAESVKELQRV